VNPGMLSPCQLRTAQVLEEALLAAGDPFPLTHAWAVVSGPHWLRLTAALRSLDEREQR
jgi:hypothetical protein